MDCKIISKLAESPPRGSIYVYVAEDGRCLILPGESGPTVQTPASEQDNVLSKLNGAVQESNGADADRPFQCTYCQKQFHQSQHLHLHVKRNHMVTSSGSGAEVVNGSHTETSTVAVSVVHDSLTDRPTVQPAAMPNSDRPFKCSYCEKSFSRAGQVKVHEKVHVEERPYPCRFCGKGFKYSWGLKVHERLHTGEKPFKCRHCDKAFASSFNKSQHEETHLGSVERKRFWCRDCHISYSRKQALKAHNQTKHAGGVQVVKWACPHCIKQFSKREDLQIHIRSHTGEKPLKCNYCSQCYARPSNLQVHMRKHIKPKPLKCEDCLELFHSKYQLAIHKRTHTGRMLQCSYCEKRFIHCGRKKLHERMHTGDKKHECTYCSRLYATLEEQKKHESKVHNNGNPFKCKYCKRCFTSGFSLRTHIKNLHAKRHNQQKKLECRYCGKRFAKYPLLLAHEEKHMETYECVRCERFFKTRSIMNTHMKRHKLRGEAVLTKAKPSLCIAKCTSELGETHYACTECDATGKEISDIMEHHRLMHSEPKELESSGKLAFLCTRCAKSFRSRMALKMHLKRHDLKGETVSKAVDAAAELSPCFVKCFGEKGQEHYVCKECGKDVQELSEAIAHQQLMHSEQGEHETGASEEMESVPGPAPSAGDVAIEILELVPEMQYREEMSQPTSDVVISQSSDSKLVKLKDVEMPPGSIDNIAFLLHSSSSAGAQTSAARPKANRTCKSMDNVCTLCLGSFSSLAALQEHEQVHGLYSHYTSLNGLLYVCKLCGRVVHEAKELVVHKNWHKQAHKKARRLCDLRGYAREGQQTFHLHILWRSCEKQDCAKTP